MGYLSLALGVIASALSIIALVVGLRHLHELRTTHAETHTLRKETLQALGLHEILVRDQLLLDAVREISTAYAVINDDKDRFFQMLAARELRGSRQRLQSISAGRLTVSEEEIAGPITFAALVLSFAEPGDEFCTSALQPPSFWRKETSYLEQNRELSKNGVTIRRIFIFDSESEFQDPEAQWEMRRQMDAGINVSYSIAPKFEPRDIIVLKKPDPHGTLAPVYAGEIMLRRNKSVANIDVWSADSNLDKVIDLTRTLEVMLASGTPFVPGYAESSPPNTPAVNRDPGRVGTVDGTATPTAGPGAHCSG